MSRSTSSLTSLSAAAPLPYQTFHTDGTSHLAALEEACARYLESGYKITSHTTNSFVLVRERRRVSLLAVIVLLAAPPICLLYLIVARNRRDRIACVRVNSQGYIEETGDTLAARRSEQRNAGIALLITACLIAAGIGWLVLSNKQSNTSAPAHVNVDGTAYSDSHISDSSVATRPRAFAPSKKSKRQSQPVEGLESYPYDIPPPPIAAPFDYASTPPPDVPATALSDTASPVAASPAIERTPKTESVKPEPLRLVNEGEVLFAAKADGSHAGEQIFTRQEVDSPVNISEQPEPGFTVAGAQTSGVVKLEAVFRPDGKVTDIRVVKGLPNGLSWSAVKAARRIRFTPAVKDGQAVPMRIRLSYNFQIN